MVKQETVDDSSRQRYECATLLQNELPSLLHQEVFGDPRATQSHLREFKPTEKVAALGFPEIAVGEQVSLPGAAGKTWRKEGNGWVAYDRLNRQVEQDASKGPASEVEQEGADLLIKFKDGSSKREKRGGAILEYDRNGNLSMIEDERGQQRNLTWSGKDLVGFSTSDGKTYSRKSLKENGSTRYLDVWEEQGGERDEPGEMPVGPVNYRADRTNGDLISTVHQGKKTGEIITYKTDRSVETIRADRSMERVYPDGSSVEFNADNTLKQMIISGSLGWDSTAWTYKFGWKKSDAGKPELVTVEQSRPGYENSDNIWTKNADGWHSVKSSDFIKRDKFSIDIQAQSITWRDMNTGATHILSPGKNETVQRKDGAELEYKSGDGVQRFTLGKVTREFVVDKRRYGEVIEIKDPANHRTYRPAPDQSGWIAVGEDGKEIKDSKGRALRYQGRPKLDEHTGDLVFEGVSDSRIKLDGSESVVSGPRADCRREYNLEDREPAGATILQNGNLEKWTRGKGLGAGVYEWHKNGDTKANIVGKAALDIDGNFILTHCDNKGQPDGRLITVNGQGSYVERSPDSVKLTTADGTVRDYKLKDSEPVSEKHTHNGTSVLWLRGESRGNGIYEWRKEGSSDSTTRSGKAVLDKSEQFTFTHYDSDGKPNGKQYSAKTDGTEEEIDSRSNTRIVYQDGMEREMTFADKTTIKFGREDKTNPSQITSFNVSSTNPDRSQTWEKIAGADQFATSQRRWNARVETSDGKYVVTDFDKQTRTTRTIDDKTTVENLLTHARFESDRGHPKRASHGDHQILYSSDEKGGVREAQDTRRNMRLSLTADGIWKASALDQAKTFKPPDTVLKGSIDILPTGDYRLSGNDHSVRTFCVDGADEKFNTRVKTGEPISEKRQADEKYIDLTYPDRRVVRLEKTENGEYKASDGKIHASKPEGFSGAAVEARDKLIEQMRDRLDDLRGARFEAYLRQFERRAADRVEAMVAGGADKATAEKEWETRIAKTYNHLAAMVRNDRPDAVYDQETRVKLAENAMFFFMEPTKMNQGPDGTCWAEAPANAIGLTAHPDAMARLLKEVTLTGKFTTLNGGENDARPKTVEVPRDLLKLGEPEKNWTIEKSDEPIYVPNCRYPHAPFQIRRSPVAQIFDNTIFALTGRTGKNHWGNYEGPDGAKNALQMITGDSLPKCTLYERHHLTDKIKNADPELKQALLEKGALLVQIPGHILTAKLVKSDNRWMIVEDDQNGADRVLGIVKDLKSWQFEPVKDVREAWYKPADPGALPVRDRPLSVTLEQGRK